MIVSETIPANMLASLASLVEARSGLRFVEGRRSELATKLARAFAESGCETWQAYLALLSSPTNRDLLDELVEMLTVGETYFYRHRPYFQLLEQEVLPEIIARRCATKQLRVWCAGCATGEEAYSLAIAIGRVLPDMEDWQVTILATDLNRRFLARAEAGVYTEWSFRETDAKFKTAHFIAEGRRYRVRSELRQAIRFAQLNLAEDGYPSALGGTAGLDLILCRNVLLYFGPDLTQRVVDRFRAALVPGGWLMLGPSDPRPGLLVDFDVHVGDGALVYRRTDREAGAIAPPGPVAKAVHDGVVAFDEPVHAHAPQTVMETQVVPLQESDAPDWREAWLAARASADDGQMELAETLCLQAIERAQMRPEPYYLFGALRQARGDDEASLAAFRKALYVDPTFAPALLAQAAIHRRGGSSERARQALLRAQRLLDGRVPDEWVLAEDGLSVGRLRDAVVQALADQG
jgi:chemotaxis protein methyltransferase CheR